MWRAERAIIPGSCRISARGGDDITSGGDDDKSRGRDFPAPEHTTRGRPHALADVGDAERQALGHEFVVRRLEHHTVERLGSLEERSRLIRSVEHRGMPIDIKPERGAPSVEPVAGHPIARARVRDDPAGDVGYNLAALQ